VLALAASLAQSLSASQPEELVLTELDNGKTNIAVPEQPISINLRGNPSTGFAWILTSTNGNSVVATAPSTYSTDPGGGVGGGGTFLFSFQAVEPGETTLLFDYLQPWNPDSRAQTFATTILVAAADALPRLSIELVNVQVAIISR